MSGKYAPNNLMSHDPYAIMNNITNIRNKTIRARSGVKQLTNQLSQGAIKNMKNIMEMKEKADQLYAKVLEKAMAFEDKYGVSMKQNVYNPQPIQYAVRPEWMNERLAHSLTKNTGMARGTLASLSHTKAQTNKMLLNRSPSLKMYHKRAMSRLPKTRKSTLPVISE